MMLFMHLLVGIRELSCTQLKKKIEKKKRLITLQTVNNTGKSIIRFLLYRGTG